MNTWDKNIRSISKKIILLFKQELYKNDHLIGMHVNTKLLNILACYRLRLQLNREYIFWTFFFKSSRINYLNLKTQLRFILTQLRFFLLMFYVYLFCPFNNHPTNSHECIVVGYERIEIKKNKNPGFYTSSHTVLCISFSSYQF